LSQDGAEGEDKGKINGEGDEIEGRIQERSYEGLLNGEL
jgi:hypothetical protein